MGRRALWRDASFVAGGVAGLAVGVAVAWQVLLPAAAAGLIAGLTAVAKRGGARRTASQALGVFGLVALLGAGLVWAVVLPR